MAARSTGSSTRIARLALLAEPPSIDRGEVTDKGSLNQRLLLANRNADVEALYASEVEAERGAAVRNAERLRRRPSCPASSRASGRLRMIMRTSALDARVKPVHDDRGEDAPATASLRAQ